MDRRNFIRNSGLAMVLTGFSPSFAMKGIYPVENKRIHFILRAVGYTDALRAFSKYNTSLKGHFSFQKVECNNPYYSHEKGLNDLMNEKISKVAFTQDMERYTIKQVVKDAFSSGQEDQYLHIHHTEIGHSSETEFNECLDTFFKKVIAHYEPGKHTIIITSDIGRNDFVNSCGGRDHSDPSALETFALYMGKNLPESGHRLGNLTQNIVFSV